MYSPKLSVDYCNVADGPWRILVRELTDSTIAQRIIKVLWDYHREKLQDIPVGQGHRATFRLDTDGRVYAEVKAEKWDIAPEALDELCKNVNETLKRILEPYITTLGIVSMLCKAGLIKEA